MKNTKHTQGEWEITYGVTQKDENGNLYNTIFGERSHTEMVCKVIGKTREQVDSNAKLIAAAPELLEALLEICYKDLYGNYRIGYNSGSIVSDKISNAIKKATE